VNLAQRLISRFFGRGPALVSPAEYSGRPDSDPGVRVTTSIAIAVGIGSLSFNFWYPFMPLYMLKIGAKDEAQALLWIAVATTVQGIARLVTGPLWGMASDRYGRKLMLLRALYLATPTTVIAAVIWHPWQMTLALAFQGLFSGFIPAAVALTSVSVAESRLHSSLSLVPGAQYIGTTAGPAVGAVLANLLGFRGAILFAACLPAVAATLVLLLVPSDQTAGGGLRDRSAQPLEPFRPTRQLALVIFFFFIIFSLTQLIRLATPVVLAQMEASNVNGVTGIAFTLAGLASAFSVLFVAPNFFRPGGQRSALVVACVLCGGAYLLLSLAGSVALFVLFFVVISLL